MSKLKDERELLSKPGDTILETLIHIKMSQAELAERMGKTPSKVNDLISGKEPITVTTAFQLEKVLGISAQFWLNREILYREKLSRLEQEEALEECKDWLKIQPIKELRECGYLKSEKIGPAMAEECLKFYGVAAPDQWQSIYIDQYVATSFRKSEAHKSTLGGMAAWLRIGEIEMRKLKLNTYSKEAFKETLIEVKDLVRNHPEDFASRLQLLCANVGVALVYTICIPKAPISGAARWIGGTPLIQLTDRYKSNDHFWFTFFHEAGHILLHGKKDVFLENLEEYVADPQKENDADQFANKSLLPNDIISELGEEITEKTIRQVARKYNTHPAIILGHLQHLKKLPYTFGPSLKLKVLLDDVINKSGDK
jgi:HTH-type transcriptional regulator/antitoxin HigA